MVFLVLGPRKRTGSKGNIGCMPPCESDKDIAPFFRKTSLWEPVGITVKSEIYGEKRMGLDEISKDENGS